ncbi:AAA family ATPase [Dolichospermum sp. UHCC 0259]|uniref:AAA family ATPase n=1 Tax=Dolichospermum sp. UHCC 0259 TaxID=2590010 RepID=UPI001445C2F3|nr:AAA family ATPase [Dolichospermum sp. UHCC 0259]MTJ46932.1 ATP-binding protein [Dolichospermum sp. UHCC 0259]
MKINQLSYYDHKREWRLEPIQFSDFNLLVGVSGVGKTRILESIINLQKIANGESFNGVEWNINFTLKNGLKYSWIGEFETKSLENLISDELNMNSKPEENKFKVVNEFLFINGTKIIERDGNNIYFSKYQDMPKLSPFKSTINILNQEEDIAPIQEGFNQVVNSNNNVNELNLFDFINTFHSMHYHSLVQKYSNLTFEDLREDNLPYKIKLALTYEYFPEKFQQIKEVFQDIFNQVEDMKLEPDEELPKNLRNGPYVKIKEKGVSNWINQSRISSGMYKTLMHTSELYLSSEGSVILIDEFENSLGVNCIDILSDLLAESRNLQFIITSHHPYIINKVGMEHWKIVTRKGGVVTAKDAKDFGLGKSRHEAFMQLINLDEYNEGISA